MANLIITIDGPAASGKSTVARLVAERLGAGFLDTGAMYRAVTLAAVQEGADLTDEEELLAVMDRSRFDFAMREGKTAVKIDGVDVTGKIRDLELTANAKYAASAPGVRERLVRMQRQIAANHRVIVTEGRDQGTVAFPDASIKFYLTAEPKERARRRQAELGTRESLAQVQQAIEERDRSDESRDVGPLRPADEAIVVDSTNLSIDEVVEKLILHIKERCS